MCSDRLIVTVPAGKVFEIDRLMGHCRHFSPGDIRLALGQAGFEIETLWRWGFPFHVVYKRLINAFPDATVNHFAGRKYSATERFIGRLITWLFYLNLTDFSVSNQIIVSARIREPIPTAVDNNSSTKGVT
jgi:hypothetical protein